MIYIMLASISLAFIMLGLAARLPNPYWTVLLHAHEACLAVFLFCSASLFMKTVSQKPVIKLRGKLLDLDDTNKLSWQQHVAFLIATTAATYRFWALRAYVEWHDKLLLDFNPWLHRGNVFSITLALIAAVIAFAHLNDTKLKNRMFAYVTLVLALVSFSPLLLPFGFLPIHPLSILFISILGAVLYFVSMVINRRFKIL